MAINCFQCKWNRIKNASKAERKVLAVTDEEIAGHCQECLASFRAECFSSKKPRTCFDCEWKDRNLPYEMRELHCQACVEAFVDKTDHDCMKCPWNNPNRRQPHDATLKHCKACLEIAKGETAMNCDTCKWKKMPESVRRPHCLSCSLKFSSSSKVRNSTNELSNKGQTIISYDNHNPEMVDDRDTVTHIDKRYMESRRSLSGAGSVHPIFHLAERGNMSAAEFAENAYDQMKRFLYEFGQLTDMQALLFLSEVKGVKKTDFAKNHNLTNSAVNSLFKQILFRSPVFKEFIILSRGSIEGTRGRKSKDGKSMEKVPKKTQKTVYLGVFQPSLAI